MKTIVDRDTLGTVFVPLRGIANNILFEQGRERESVNRAAVVARWLR